MIRRHSSILILLITATLIVGYSNCSQTHKSAPPQPVQRLYGTEVGNPLTSTALVSEICAVLVSSNSTLNGEDCKSGVIKASFSETVGVPPKTLEPFRSLVDAEQAGAIVADSVSLNQCLAKIRGLDPKAPEVLASYKQDTMNPFSDISGMVTATDGACAEVYSKNAFVPPKPPVDPPGVVVVNFDDPLPSPRIYDPVHGIYKGIEFPVAQDWFWQAPFDADTTNSIYPSGEFPANFSFSTGPKKLRSISFFSSQTGTVVVSDDNGQSASMQVPADSKMHTLTFNFAKPSSQVTVQFPYRWRLALDDITYEIPESESPIYYVQGNSTRYTQALTSLNFASGNTAGNTIVAIVGWDQRFTLQSLTDTNGNTYRPVSSPIDTPYWQGVRPHYQIWYASNIKGGANSLQLRISGSIPASDYVQREFHIFEYAGLDPVNPVDTYSNQTGYGTNITSGPIVPTRTPALLFGFIRGDQDEAVSNGGFLIRSPTTAPTPTVFGDRIATDTSPSTFTGTLSRNSTPWIATIISFKGK